MNVTLELGKRLIESAKESHIPAKLFGGVGIELSVGARPLSLKRPIEDVDLVVEAEHGPRLERLFAGMGLEGDRRFNALNGDRRQIHWEGRTKVDLFIGALSLCHELDFSGRLGHEHPALAPADLLLTKLQIVELTDKDTKDILSLLLTHEIAGTDRPGMIDASCIAHFTSRDWGLYTTVSDNLAVVAERATGMLPAGAEVVTRRIDELLKDIEESPKSSRWKLRSRVGRRLRWYQLPEER
jgi:hypothetical protein